jgi:hypothetical protein
MSDEVAAAADPDLTLPDVHIIAHHAEPMRLKQRKVCACARACVRVRVRACACVRVRACACMRVLADACVV